MVALAYEPMIILHCVLGVQEFQTSSNGVALACHRRPAICNTEMMVTDINQVPQACAKIVIPVPIKSFEYRPVELNLGRYAYCSSDTTRNKPR